MTENSMRIYIDADACPVKDEVVRVAGRHGLVVTFVANFGLRPSRDPMIVNIGVPQGADAIEPAQREKDLPLGIERRGAAALTGGDRRTLVRRAGVARRAGRAVGHTLLVGRIAAAAAAVGAVAARLAGRAARDAGAVTARQARRVAGRARAARLAGAAAHLANAGGAVAAAAAARAGGAVGGAAAPRDPPPVVLQPGGLPDPPGVPRAAADLPDGRAPGCR